jgi:hypothetical protein
MGIKGLTKLLGDNAARCIKEHELKSYFGRKYVGAVGFHLPSHCIRTSFMSR